MSTTLKSVLIKIFFIAVFGFLLLLVLQWAEKLPASQNQTENPSPINLKLEVVVAQHLYQNGNHILEGELELPNPCYKMDVVGGMDQESGKAILDFKISPPAGDEICIQVIDQRKFHVEFPGPPNPQIVAFVNNREVSTVIRDQGGTLVPGR